MRLKTAVLLACVWLASSDAALAQVDMGNEVTVNPVYGGRGGVLLYPGGQYMRVVPPLLQPGQNPRQVIHLHMPGKHPASLAVARTPRQTRTASAAPATSPSIPGYTPLGADTGSAAAPAPAPPPRRAPAPKPAPAPAAKTAAAPPSSGSGLNTGFGGLTSGSLLSSPAPAPAPATRVAKAEPPPPAANPAASEPLTPGLTKRSVILFAPDASDPARSALGAIKFLAGDLNTAMSGPTARIQILAYGGPHGDKGSDARRLSLKRALAIRQVLIDDGVSPDRIDVRAMGGADDSGPADRVDVYIKA
jgi:outer membrane protein OmpA-like peptidoglycan-associated protein